MRVEEFRREKFTVTKAPASWSHRSGCIHFCEGPVICSPFEDPGGGDKHYSSRPTRQCRGEVPERGEVAIRPVRGLLNIGSKGEHHRIHSRQFTLDRFPEVHRQGRECARQACRVAAEREHLRPGTYKAFTQARTKLPATDEQDPSKRFLHRSSWVGHVRQSKVSSRSRHPEGPNGSSNSSRSILSRAMRSPSCDNGVYFEFNRDKIIGNCMTTSSETGPRRCLLDLRVVSARLLLDSLQRGVQYVQRAPVAGRAEFEARYGYALT